MVEILALSKLIQCEKKYAPWIDKDFIDEAAKRDKLHSIAIDNNTNENWHMYKMQCNVVNHLVKSKISLYFFFQTHILL